MSNQTNRSVKKVYDAVYRKGETQHYTRLIFSKGGLTEDKQAVLESISWKGKTVLDVGCGTGEVAHLIAKKGAKEVLGIDYSPEAIREAKARGDLKNLAFKEVSLQKIPGTFDVVISMGTLEHTDDPYTAFTDLLRHVKKGGSLLLTCPNWLNPRGYMLQTLEKLFGAKITLADIHYLTPLQFIDWAKKLKLKLTWKTVDHDWAHGAKLVADFKRRIPNVLRDSKLPVDEKRIASYVEWIESHVVRIEKDTPFGGVTGVYHFKK